MSLLLKRDPGPCPVDDAPHTTCNSADYEPTKGRQVVVKQQRPLADVIHHRELSAPRAQGRSAVSAWAENQTAQDRKGKRRTRASLKRKRSARTVGRASASQPDGSRDPPARLPLW